MAQPVDRADVLKRAAHALARRSSPTLNDNTDMATPVDSSHWPWHFVIAAICLAILGAHVWLAWTTCNWSWVTRSGTLIVVAGILWESWLILKTPRADDLPFFGPSQAAHTAIRVAIVIVCVGTLVQGYGDSVSYILPACR